MGAQDTATTRQFLVRVQGIDGYFSTKTGGNIGGDVGRDFDGGSLQSNLLPGPPVPEDITVGRGYKPARDAAVLAQLRPRVMRWRTSVSVTPTDEDLIPVASPTVYNGLLSGLSDPEVNANNGDAARMELTFTLSSVV